MKELTSNTKPEEAFKLADGTTIKNVLELKDTLKKMNKEVFNNHVNPTKNDFYSWVKDIYKDEILAESIKNIKSPENIIRLIEKRLEDTDKEKQKEVKEIIDAIEKVKNGPIKKPVKMEQKTKIDEKKMKKETTREKIINKLNNRFKTKGKSNAKKLNLIPICRLDREDMIKKIKEGYENE